MGLFRSPQPRAMSFQNLGLSVADENNPPPPPVFVKHDEAQQLKGHKPQKQGPKPGVKPMARAASFRPPSGASWSDSANDNKNAFTDDLVIPAFKKKSSAVSSSEQTPESYIEEVIEEEEYIEEIVEDDEYYEEEIIEDDEHPVKETTITFDEYDEMQNTIHINDFTDSELNKSWYKRDDYDKMVASARKLVEREKEGKKLAVGQDTRGLEAWRDAVEVRGLKERALEAVWDEQSRQWKTGDYDVEKMRKAYLTVSEGAQKTAIQRAKQDELDAAEIRRTAADDDIKRKRRARMKMNKALGVSVRAIGKTGRVLGRAGLGVATLDRRMIKESMGTKKKNVNTEIERKISRMPSLAARKLMCDQDNNSIALSMSEKHMHDAESGKVSVQERFHSSTPVLGGAAASSLSLGLTDARSVGSRSVGSLDSIHEDGAESVIETPSRKAQKLKIMGFEDGKIVDTPKRKDQKLKLLGLVPIPGTRKLYAEDLQKKRLEDRRKQMTRMPSWETGMSAGKC